MLSGDIVLQNPYSTRTTFTLGSRNVEIIANFESISSSTNPPTTQPTSPPTTAPANHLLRGIDLTSVNQIRVSTLAHEQIITPQNIAPIRSGRSVGGVNITWKDFNDYSLRRNTSTTFEETTNNLAFSFSQDNNLNVRKLMASVSMNFGFYTEFIRSSNTSAESFTDRVALQYIKRTVSIIDFYYHATQDSLRNMLTSAFLHDLQHLDAKTLFGRYGSHIIVSHAIGGEAIHTRSIHNTTSTFSTSLRNAINIDISAAFPIKGFTIAGSANYESDISLNHSEQSHNYRHYQDITIIGGNPGHLATDNINEDNVLQWINSVIDSPQADIILDDNLRLAPIWMFLEEGSARYNELEQTFEQLLDERLSQSGGNPS